MSVVSPTGGGAADETRKAVSGWKSMQKGKRTESRRERLARERQENRGKPTDPDGITSDMKRQAILEAQRNAEDEIENPMKHLKEAYKAKRQEEANKRKAKLDPTKTLLLLTEVSEKGGKIVSVQEAGFNQFLVEYIL